MKRISLLLITLALCTLFSANSAFACVRCGIDRENPDCAICRYVVLSGADDCQFYPPLCDLCDEVGTCHFTASAATAQPLATQYAVASVERLDEQHTNPNAVTTVHLAFQPTR